MFRCSNLITFWKSGFSKVHAIHVVLNEPGFFKKYERCIFFSLSYHGKCERCYFNKFVLKIIVTRNNIIWKFRPWKSDFFWLPKICLKIFKQPASQWTGFYMIRPATLLKKETLAQVFSCEFCEISKNSFSYRTPLVAASEKFLYRSKDVYVNIFVRR